MTVIFVALSESYIIYPITKLTESDMAEQNRDIRQFSENVMKMQDGIIIIMADMVENRDSDTGDHIQKTAGYVRVILRGLKRKGTQFDPKCVEVFMDALPDIKAILRRYSRK